MHGFPRSIELGNYPAHCLCKAYAESANGTATAVVARLLAITFELDRTQAALPDTENAVLVSERLDLDRIETYICNVKTPLDHTS